MIFEHQATDTYHVVGLKLDCSSLIRMVYLPCSNSFWGGLNFVLFIYLLR